MHAPRSSSRVTLPKFPPGVINWRADSLPRRVVRVAGRPAPLPFGTAAPPHLPTGPVDQPFDFCSAIRRLCTAVAAQCEAFRHIDVNRILFAVAQARNGRTHGLQARVTPMRFRGGDLSRRQHGIDYQVQRFRLDGREILYVVSFCLPRFLNLDFDEKVVTLFHELYHISPEFDGDLRRHAGRYQVHTHSQKHYDEEMGHLARAYLAADADPDLHAFLRLNFAQLRQKHGSILGVFPPRPKLIPLLRSRAAIEFKGSTERE